MEQDATRHIDIDHVLKTRAGRYYRFIPKWLVRWLERTICQDQINRLWSRNAGHGAGAMCAGMMRDLDVTLDIVNPQALPPTGDRRVVFVSNHPLGGLDGITLIDFLTRRYGVEPLFIVNDLLMFITPLRDVFVPINKHGAQSRESVKAIDEAFAGDRPLIIFPAGLVSRRQKKGEIRDLDWQKMFVLKSKASKRDIIPLYFDGENSPFFYKFARRRKRLGLKFNIEMIYLPREVFRSAGKRFRLVVGKRIRWDELGANSQAAAKAAQIKDAVYRLRDSIQSTH